MSNCGELESRKRYTYDILQPDLVETVEGLTGDVGRPGLRHGSSLSLLNDRQGGLGGGDGRTSGHTGQGKKSSSCGHCDECSKSAKIRSIRERKLLADRRKKNLPASSFYNRIACLSAGTCASRCDRRDGHRRMVRREWSKVGPMIATD